LKKIIFSALLSSVSLFGENIEVKSGWNLLGSRGLNIDLNSTFSQNSDIQIVWVFDNEEQSWKVWGNNDNFRQKISENNYETIDEISNFQPFWIQNIGDDVNLSVFDEKQLLNGLVAHYEFEGNANDSSGNENHGTEHGGVSYVDGIIGKAGSFDGIDDYIDTGVQPKSVNNSYSFWVKANRIDYGTQNNLENSSHILEQWGATGYGNASFALYLQQGKLNLTSYTGTEWGLSDSLSFDTEWHNIVFLFDEKRRKLSIDGVIIIDEENKAPQLSTQYNIFIAQTNVPFYLVKSFNGLIDDLRIYNRALTEKEIEALYKMGLESGL
jgi:hypothetical protein